VDITSYRVLSVARERYRQHRVHKTKQTQNTICVAHHYAQTNTNNVNKTRALLQTNTNDVNKTRALLQTNTNDVNKTRALLQTKTYNVNKTSALLQTTEDKDESNIVADITTRNSKGKTHKWTTQKAKKMSNTENTKNSGVNSGAREG
jgi:hypothetical protein